MTRRRFVRGATALPFCAAWGIAAPSKAVLKVSLNAYSFNKLLSDHTVTLLDVLDFSAKNKFDGLDPTGYYFPGYPAVPANAFVDQLKKRAADLGVGISGTGVRNNFTTSDKTVRDASVQHIKEWVEVAARLGAPVLRVFADTQGRQTWEAVSQGFTREQVQEWIAADLRECAEHGKKYGVRIGVQNHADFLKTGPQVLSLIKAVGSDWCRPILDIGSFRTPDPYQDMAMVAPYAVNWQIKTSVSGEDTSIPTDLIRVMTVVRKSGYSGYLPIETLAPRGKEYDPFTMVPVFLKQVREAIAATA
jgi:Xylose isomerase-like TIM barrel